MPVPPGQPGSSGPQGGLRELYRLLAELFTAEELRGFLHLDLGLPVLVDSLPGTAASKAELMQAAVLALSRHGRVGPGLYAALRRVRPAQADRITEVEGAWTAPEQVPTAGDGLQEVFPGRVYAEASSLFWRAPAFRLAVPAGWTAGVNLLGKQGNLDFSWNHGPAAGYCHGLQGLASDELRTFMQSPENVSFLLPGVALAPVGELEERSGGLWARYLGAGQVGLAVAQAGPDNRQAIFFLVGPEGVEHHLREAMAAVLTGLVFEALPSHEGVDAWNRRLAGHWWGVEAEIDEPNAGIALFADGRYRLARFPGSRRWFHALTDPLHFAFHDEGPFEPHEGTWKVAVMGSRVFIIMKRPDMPGWAYANALLWDGERCFSDGRRLISVALGADDTLG